MPPAVRGCRGRTRSNRAVKVHAVSRKHQYRHYVHPNSTGNSEVPGSGVMHQMLVAPRLTSRCCLRDKYLPATDFVEVADVSSRRIVR